MENTKQSALTNRCISAVLALFLILSFFPVLAHAGTKAARAKIAISPKKAGPGDIMVVTVKGGQAPVEGTFLGKPLHFNEAKQGFKAIIGVDLNAEPGDYPLELSVNGAKLSRAVKIVKKKYPVQKLTLPQDMVVLSPENEARAEREQKKVVALWPVDSLRLWNGNFIDPVPGKKIGSGVFGVRRIINNVPKNPHSGVDVLADEGEPVHAPNDGVAVLVDNQFYSGNCVFLDHGQGIYTMFFHLSKVNVQTGQAVMKGDVIGLVGATGRASGAHLHWGVRIQGAKVDPLELIRLKLE